MFKVIGRKLGGFIDVAEDTLSFNRMNYAKLQVKGGRNGFLSITLDLPRGSNIVTLGIFPLEESNSWKPVRVCRSIGPMARHSESRERQMAQDREICQSLELQSIDILSPMEACLPTIPTGPSVNGVLLEMKSIEQVPMNLLPNNAFKENQYLSK